MPGNPAQNGMAESLGQTIQRKASVLLKDSGLPQSNWSEMVTTANCLRNFYTSQTRWVRGGPHLPYGASRRIDLALRKKAKTIREETKDVLVWTRYLACGWRGWCRSFLEFHSSSFTTGRSYPLCCHPECTKYTYRNFPCCSSSNTSAGANEVDSGISRHPSPARANPIRCHRSTRC